MDIPNGKPVEEQLRQSEARFATVFRALPMGALFSRISDRRFVEVNAAWEKLTGYSREEILGRTSVELNLWANPLQRDMLFREFAERGYVRDFTARLRQKSGAERELLLSMDHIELFGEPCLLLLAHDVTELRQLERELRQSQKMEAIGRLAGGLAHDYNNILMAISGADTLLLDGLGVNDPLREYAEQIKRSTARAAKLTHQLLTFTRKKPEQPVVLDPNEIVLGVVEMLRRMIGADVALSTELHARGHVKADPGSLEQVTMNLAVNARDAMPTGGVLTLRTADVDNDNSVLPGPWVMLEVADTGVGMDDQTRAHLFEPFFTTKEPGKGTGLGLSTVYGIVTQCRGHIMVDSAPGRGSTFRVLLPREGGAPRKELPQRSAAPAPAGRETILLVEDDDDVRDFLRYVLRERGYRVLEAQDGLGALEVARNTEERIDLLLSDIVMPRLDGIELSRQLSELRPAMRILLMSGYPGDATTLGSLPAQLLCKPFERDDLIRCVRDVLDGRETSPDDPEADPIP
jgi:PAS domain S-box-containing protein